MRSRMLSVLAVGLGLLTGVARAQEAGDIAGRLTRDDGAALAAASVVLRETGAATVTDRQGRFRFDGLPAGTYSLALTLGENTAVHEGVEVAAGRTVDVEVFVDWEVSFAESITVTSVSRQTERIVEAPAAVSVITAEEIDREASHGQVPKLLEFTPGADVTQSGIYDYNLNTRGFNSSLNRRVATLIDGRDPSVPFLGSQEWAAVSFPLDDISSLELVRGPSAALYGANASSGVLNVVTKAPRDSEGGEVRLIAGELSTLNADVRWASELGSGWYLKLLGGLRDHGDFTVSRVGAAEYSVPCTPAQRTDCLPQEVVPLGREDDDEIAFGGVRLDKYFGASLLTLEGGQATVKGPVFQTGIGRVQVLDAERPWARANFAAESWNVLGYWNGRDATEQLALSAGSNIPLDDTNWQVEVQGNWRFAGDRARVVLGASHGEEEIDSFDPRQGAQTLIFAPIDAESDAVFGQVDWELGSEIKVVLAARWDDSTLHDSEFSPKGAIVWTFRPHHTLRLTYNEAFQVPNYSELFLQANAAPPVDLSGIEAICLAGGVSCDFAPGPTRVLALGNEDLEVEEVDAIEIGYSGILADRALLTVDYYNSRNDNFITDLLPQLGTALGRINPGFGPYQPPAELAPPLQAALLATLQVALGPSFFILSNNLDGTPIFAAASYTNFGNVDTQGVDIGLDCPATEAWTVSFAYSWFDFEIEQDAPGLEQILLPNTPEHKASLGVTYVGEAWDARVSGRWVDDFRWIVGPFQGDVDSYTSVDLGGNYHVDEHWSVGLDVSNLFDDEHWEAFGGDLLGRRALGHVAFRW